MFQDMKEEMGIEGEVGADTVTREMKIVMIIKDMSMTWSTMAKRVMTRSNDDVNDNSKAKDETCMQCQRQNGANGNNDDYDEFC